MRESLIKAFGEVEEIDLLKARLHPLWLKSELKINGIDCNLVIVKVRKDLSALTNKGWVEDITQLINHEHDYATLISEIKTYSKKV